MPIYEYVCSSCGHDMEVMQSISEAPLKQCPKCKRRTLKKLVSAAGFQLKGTGWYVTDFRDKGKEGKKEKGEAESTTETKADETKKGEKESKDSKKPEKTEKRKSDTKKKPAAD